MKKSKKKERMIVVDDSTDTLEVLKRNLESAGYLVITAQGAVEAGSVTVAPDGVQEVTLLVQDDYVFTPDAFTVAPGRVRLTVRSVAEQLTHNFLFTEGAGPMPIEEEIPILAPGDEDTIEFAVDQPGDYGFECSFHVALGQVGTMTVSPA